MPLTPRRWAWIASGGVFLFAGAVALLRRGAGGGVAGRPSGFPSWVRGRKLTDAPVGADGSVAHDPAALARGAFDALRRIWPATVAPSTVNVETYALARFVGSEFSSGSFIEKASIAWAILNRTRLRDRVRAGGRRWDLRTMAVVACRGRGCEDTQRFGRQDMPDGRVRYASTARDPTDADLYVALAVLSGALPDPTGGAHMFFDPEAQEALRRRRPDRYRSVPELTAKWESEGNRVVRVPGVREGKLVLFRPA